MEYYLATLACSADKHIRLTADSIMHFTSRNQSLVSVIHQENYAVRHVLKAGLHMGMGF